MTHVANTVLEEKTEMVVNRLIELANEGNIGALRMLVAHILAGDDGALEPPSVPRDTQERARRVLQFLNAPAAERKNFPLLRGDCLAILQLGIKICQRYGEK